MPNCKCEIIKFCNTLLVFSYNANHDFVSVNIILSCKNRRNKQTCSCRRCAIIFPFWASWTCFTRITLNTQTFLITSSIFICIFITVSACWSASFVELSSWAFYSVKKKHMSKPCNVIYYDLSGCRNNRAKFWFVIFLYLHIYTSDS